MILVLFSEFVFRSLVEEVDILCFLTWWGGMLVGVVLVGKSGGGGRKKGGRRRRRRKGRRQRRKEERRLSSKTAAAEYSIKNQRDYASTLALSKGVIPARQHRDPLPSTPSSSPHVCARL